MTRTALSLLAGALEYPREDVVPACRLLIEELGPGRAEAVRAIEAFVDSIEPLPATRREEIYMSTFDVNPACCLYVGYHLHGDSYKRGAFMARLNHEYRDRGFEPGNELPDHLPVMLRFLAELEDEDLAAELIESAIVPVLARIVRAFDVTENVYAALARGALGALAPDDYVAPDRNAMDLPMLGQDTPEPQGVIDG